MNHAPAAVLAVDAGNSKTDLALVGHDGTLLGSARGHGMRKEHSLRDKVDLLTKLISDAGGQVTAGQPVARHICACVANADLPQDEEEFAAALRSQGWSDTVEVVNDTFAVLRAGFGTRAPAGDQGGAGEAATRYWGVAVTCGAGINCVGVSPDGRTHRYLALGYETGDWGGGSGIGRDAVWHAARAEDGRGPATALAKSIPVHFGLSTMAEVGIAFHFDYDEERYVELPPVVEAAAMAGDEVAVGIERHQAEEICGMVLTSMRQLELTGLATPVMLGGGIMRGADPILMGGIVAGLASAAPRAEPHVVTLPPIAGAALLGLDHLAADQATHQRLADSY